MLYYFRVIIGVISLSVILESIVVESGTMKCDVEYSDEFGDWWYDLSEDEQDSVSSYVGLLEARGVALKYPHTSSVESSKHGHMRELRIQHCGNPYRILYAF